jgi:hypothetical protein
MVSCCIYQLTCHGVRVSWFQSVTVSACHGVGCQVAKLYLSAHLSWCRCVADPKLLNPDPDASFLLAQIRFHPGFVRPKIRAGFRQE